MFSNNCRKKYLGRKDFSKESFNPSAASTDKLCGIVYVGKSLKKSKNSPLKNLKKVILPTYQNPAYVPKPVFPQDYSSHDYFSNEDDLIIDPENVRHYLQNAWTMWYLESDRDKTWEDMQMEISTINTVEDFWIMYSHFKPPSQLRPGCDYSFFKRGIRPMWEDPANKKGGRWVLTLFKNCKEDLDNIWLDVMLCMIGENLRNSNEVCGAVVSIRGKNNKISLWTSNGSNEKAILEIGWRLREALKLGCHNLKYQYHKDLMGTTKIPVQSAYVL